MPRPFKSQISRREPILDERTAIEAVVPPDVHRGFKNPPKSFNAFDSPYALGFQASGIQLIDRSEWPERTEEMERKKTRISDIVIAAGYRIKNQARTNYCHMNGSVSAVEACNILQGGKYVELSPASAAAPMTGFRNIGGWAAPDLKYLAEHGCCPVELWPQAAIDRRYYTPENREIAKRFRPRTYVPLKTFDELYSCLLQRIPCTHGSMRWGHLVAAFDPVVQSRGRYGVRIANSWNVTWGDKGWGVLTEDFGFDECVAVFDSRPVFWEG